MMGSSRRSIHFAPPDENFGLTSPNGEAPKITNGSLQGTSDLKPKKQAKVEIAKPVINVIHASARHGNLIVARSAAMALIKHLNVLIEHEEEAVRPE